METNWFWIAAENIEKEREKKKTVNRINLVQFIQFARNTLCVSFFSLKWIQKEPNKWLNVHLFTIEAENRATNNHNVIDRYINLFMSVSFISIAKIDDIKAPS